MQHLIAPTDQSLTLISERMHADVLRLIFSQLEACHLLALNWTCHYLSRLILQWMPPPVKQLTLRSAAHSGTLSLFQWTEPFASSCRPIDIYCEAASGGKLEIILYLGDTEFYPHCRDVLAMAARTGHLNILGYWFDRAVDENLRTTYMEMILMVAIEYHQAEIVKWVMPHCNELMRQDYYYCAKAAERDDLEILKILRCNDFMWEQFTYISAVKGGTLPLLKWIDEQNCRQSKIDISIAIEHDRVETVKWLRQKGKKWCHSPIALAVMSGRMEMLVYLREEEGLEWKGEVCATAIREQRLDMLQYVRSQGCPWGECEFLLLGVPEEIHRWSYENGCPVDKFFARLILPHHPDWKRII